MNTAPYEYALSKYRFPVPNKVFLHKLRPAQFAILSFLYYRDRHPVAGEILTPEIIGSNIRMRKGTVKKHLSVLAQKMIIVSENVLALSDPPDHSKLRSCFTMPNEVFLLQLPASALMVYAYLLSCEDRESYTCYPSFTTMARITGLSITTLQNAITTLVDRKLISVKPQKCFKYGMKLQSNNLYTILPISIAVDEFYRRQLAQKGS